MKQQHRQLTPVSLLADVFNNEAAHVGGSGPRGDLNIATGTADALEASFADTAFVLHKVTSTQSSGRLAPCESFSLHTGA